MCFDQERFPYNNLVGIYDGKTLTSYFSSSDEWTEEKKEPIQKISGGEESLLLERFTQPDMVGVAENDIGLAQQVDEIQGDFQNIMATAVYIIIK